MRTHLHECECCQREEIELRLLKDLLVGVPAIEPPAGFEDRLCDAIFSPEPSETAKVVGSWPFVSGVALVTAALTLFVISRVNVPSPTADARATDVVAHERMRDQSLDASDPFMDSAPILTASYGTK